MSILQGPSFAFIPPLLAYTKLTQCDAKLTDIVPEEEYLGRIRVVCFLSLKFNAMFFKVSGSLFIASICLTLIGATGLVSVISKRVGPLTIAPLMILLCKLTDFLSILNYTFKASETCLSSLKKHLFTGCL